MKQFLVAILCMGTLVPGTFFEESPLGSGLADFSGHDESSVLHTHNHYHGDEDDRHERPEDPCQHESQDCCCTHVPPGLYNQVAVRVGESSERLNLPVFRAVSLPLVRPAFHVPIV